MTSCFTCGQNYCGACDKYDSCEEYDAETFSTETDPEYDGLNHHGDLPFKEMDKIYKDIRKEREYNMNHPKDGSKVPLSRRKDWELITDELLDDSPPLLTTEALYEDKSGNSNTFYTLPFHFDLTNYTSPFKINPNDKNDYRWDYPNFNFDPVNPRGYASLIISDGKEEGRIISSHPLKEMNAETFEAIVGTLNSCPECDESLSGVYLLDNAYGTQDRVQSCKCGWHEVEPAYDAETFESESDCREAKEEVKKLRRKIALLDKLHDKENALHHEILGSGGFFKEHELKGLFSEKDLENYEYWS
jgi:hypothetical protein